MGRTHGPAANTKDDHSGLQRELESGGEIPPDFEPDAESVYGMRGN